jgi:3-dehydroquinate synthase
MRTVRVSLGPRSYGVQIAPGARSALPAVLAATSAGHRAVVVADERVAGLHWDTLRGSLPPDTALVTVPPGEASKSLTSASGIYDALARARVERDDVIIAFGGGMVGDLAGFVAATWLRGIRFLQVPTTLESAIDASVGGKTAVNHPAGKNLIGVFHQPIAVIIDTQFLGTLPERDFVAGLGESVKHALIRAPEFLRWHESLADAIVAREPDVVVELIARNCEIKAAVVEQDEREHNLRAILNFGHTVGHAIEHLLEFELRHGECVALGVIVADELACSRGHLNRGVAERAKALIARLGLPTHLPRAIDPEAIVATCRMDKKVRAGAVSFVLIRAPGETVQVADIADAEIVAALRAIQ